MRNCNSLSNLRKNGFVLTMDVKGQGSITVDFSLLPDFLQDFKHLHDPAEFAKVKIDAGSLHFPPDIHVDPEYVMEAAEEQKEIINSQT
jgi:hypothetical protein